MKIKFSSLAIALILNVSAAWAGLPAEFSVANADGILISYGKCESWLDQCGEPNGLLVTFHASSAKYAGEVVIPQSVVHGGITYRVIGIAPFAFDACTNLKSVSIPLSVYYIDAYAFQNNSSLTDIYVEWSDPSVVTVESGTTFDGLAASNITLHVPVGAKALYENSNVWKNFNIVDDGKIADNSGIAQLSSLAISAGVLSPAFSPSHYSYTVIVPKSVENITLTATPMYGGSVSGGGQKPLNIGENNFSLPVTSANGAQQNTYTVKVIRLQSDLVLELLFAANQTSDTYYFNAPNNVKLFIQDRRQVTYRLTTGNISGDVPLRFAVGGKTLDRTITVQPNYIYEIGVRIWIDKTGIHLTTHYDSYGRPSYAEIVYPNRATATVTVSGNGETLLSSQTELLGPPESIEFLAIVAKGASSIAGASVEPARPAGYYSITGQKLNREPDSGIYIIKYDNGKAEKALKKKQ